VHNKKEAKMIKPRLVIALLFLPLLLTAQTPQFLKLKSGQPIFASGINLAWINFGEDLTGFDQARFVKALDEIAAAGGNTVRWWLHLNGSASPTFTDGMVTGLSPQEIPNLQRALDLAHERGLLIMPVLWSFDMLQNQKGVNLEQNKNLLEKLECTRAYIDNALIPLIRAFKDHPAVLCWEICNEPEGMTPKFGWSTRRTETKYVQQFHNLLAGAIHREAPGALVTTGCWNIQVVSGREGFENWYCDAALIAAGGDTLGTLDFYQVHYYPRWYDENYSPFHHPATYWQVDKPMLIGEFPAKGLVDLGHGYRPQTTKSSLEAYQYAIENGYAGCLSWTWTGHDGNGGINDAAPGLRYVKEKYPELVIIR
jgi:hypothetical protein